MTSEDFIPLNKLIFPRSVKYYRPPFISSFEHPPSPFPDIFQPDLLQLIYEYLSIREILNLSEVNQYFYQQLVSVFFHWRLQIGSYEALKEFNSQFENTIKFPEGAWIGLTTLEIPDFEVDQIDLWPILKRTKQLKVANFQPSSEWYRDERGSKQIFEKFNELHTQNINVIVSPDLREPIFNITETYSGHLHINGFRIGKTKLLVIGIISILPVVGIFIGCFKLFEYILLASPNLSNFLEMLIVFGLTVVGVWIFALALWGISFIVRYCFTFSRKTRTYRPGIEMEPILV